jgi:hypothetical protein
LAGKFFSERDLSDVRLHHQPAKNVQPKPSAVPSTVATIGFRMQNR